MPAGDSTISVKNVIKQFGRFAALRGVSAEFDPGRFHAILGDNGAGKTTLLRAIAGLAQPTQGTISIFGKNPREACRDIGYMSSKDSILETVIGLVLLGILAGALAGLGVGLMTGRSSSGSSTSTQ